MHDLISHGGAADTAPDLSHALQRALWSKHGLIEVLPIAVYVCDLDGLIVQYNKRAAELWGRSPRPGDTEQRFCGSLRLYLPDGEPLPHAETPMADALRTHQPKRAEEVWIERADGSRIAVVVNIDPLFDEQGRCVGAVNCFQDVTQSKRAERAAQASEGKLRQLIEAIPTAMYTTDDEGRLTSYNAAAVALWGREPKLGDESWCGSWKLYRTDGTPLPLDECPMAVSLKEGRALNGVQAIAEKPDGQRVPFLAYPTPLRDETGAVIGAVNMLVDIAEHERASEALRVSEEFMHRVLESSRDGIKVLDLQGRVQTINEYGQAHLERDQILNMNYADLWTGADRAAALRAIRRARGGKMGRFTACYRAPSGRITWWDKVVSPILNAAGEPERLLVVSRDITEFKIVQEQRELLIDELNHRVKNTLATVQSIASQTIRSGQEPNKVIATLEARLLALSQAHDHLSNTGWKSADFRSILTDVLGPFRSGQPDRIRLRGKPVRLSPNATVTMAMVVHELTTNAGKYGSLSCEEGRLSVTWGIRSKGEGQVLRVQWREQGGPPVEPPERRGFGSRLIERGIAHQLGGSAAVKYDPSGLRCILEIPLIYGDS